MTENDDSVPDPIPGWPSPSEPPAAPEGPPTWAPPSGAPSGAPTYPPGAQPPPAAGPPGAYPPGAYPPGGYGPPPTVPPGPNVPPGPGGYGPPPGYGYGGQGFGAYPVAREHPQGTTILVLGICSWVICGLAAPFAWIMGNNALKEIDRNPAAYSNRGNVQAGRILGMVYTILIGVGLLFFGVLVIIGLAAGSTSS